MSKRRRPTDDKATVLGLFVASLAFHALIVSTVDIRQPVAGLNDPKNLLSAEEIAAAEAIDLSFSCVADVAAATSVRLTYCATPSPAERDKCADQALHDFSIEVIACYRVDSPADKVAVAAVDIDKIRPQPIMPAVAPIDDIVAAELIEEEVAKKIEEAQKSISNPKLSGQVVEITKPQLEMRPDKARYLSEYDSSAEKETVARGSTEEMVAKPSPRETAPSPTPTPNPDDPTTRDQIKEDVLAKAGEPGQGEGPRSPGLMSMRGPGTGTAQPLARIDPSEAGSKTGPVAAAIDGIGQRRGDGVQRDRREEVYEPAGGGSEGGGGATTVPNLRPSEEVLSRAVGGGSVDKLNGVESGDFTALNSRKWKYASFFNRMKRQVAQNWHPDRVYLRRDPTGKVYGTKDRLTVLKVSLEPSGSLAKVFIAKQSGIDFLDDEAVRAFHEAQPFPNPPGALVDTGSKLITFSFGFHFQIGGSSDRWKIFRYK